MSTATPGWRMDLNSPRRFTTPTLPCWTIFKDRSNDHRMTRTTTPMTTPITTTPTPALATMAYLLSSASRHFSTVGSVWPHRSRLLRGKNDQEAPLDAGHDDVGPDRDRGVGVKGNGQPVLTPGPDGP